MNESMYNLVTLSNLSMALTVFINKSPNFFKFLAWKKITDVLYYVSQIFSKMFFKLKLILHQRIKAMDQRDHVTEFL